MLMPGDWVRVRPAREIASTLDEEGCLEGLPFMPEMASRCGQAFQVQMRAEHTCTFPYTGHRRLANAVVLRSLRCDGADHGGCQLGCMMFWKEAWLQRVGAAAVIARESQWTAPPEFRARRRDDPDRFICQGTELARATTPDDASKYEPRQYVALVRSRTMNLRELFAMFAGAIQRKLQRALRAIIPARAKLDPSSAEPLALKVGDLVTVRSKDSVRATLDEHGRLRGLLFAETMYAYCGKTMKVSAIVERIIDERNGRLRKFPPGTVLLEDAICDRYRGCARNMPIMWREAWLARAEETVAAVHEPARWRARKAGAGGRLDRQPVVPPCLASSLAKDPGDARARQRPPQVQTTALPHTPGSP